jgi:hypothetical protein
LLALREVILLAGEEKIFCTPASKNAIQWNGLGLYKNSYSTLMKYIYSRHP